MTTTTTKNGQQRKSLAEQIDRLDSVIDALALGLNEAVASAVQEAAGVAIQQAVKLAIVEVLSNPALLKKVAGTVTPEPQPTSPASAMGSSLWSRVKGVAKAAWGKVCQLVKGACGIGVAVVRVGCSTARSLMAAVGTKAIEGARFSWAWSMVFAGLAKRFRLPLLIALGSGVLIGVGCYFAGPVVSSLGNGVAGFVGALIAAGVNAVRRALASGEMTFG